MYNKLLNFLSNFFESVLPLDALLNLMFIRIKQDLSSFALSVPACHFQRLFLHSLYRFEVCSRNHCPSYAGFGPFRLLVSFSRIHQMLQALPHSLKIYLRLNTLYNRTQSEQAFYLHFLWCSHEYRLKPEGAFARAFIKRKAFLNSVSLSIGVKTFFSSINEHTPF